MVVIVGAIEELEKSLIVEHARLTLWKDADSDIPVLIAAKAEYAKIAVSRGGIVSATRDSRIFRYHLFMRRA